MSYKILFEDGTVVKHKLSGEKMIIISRGRGAFGMAVDFKVTCKRYIDGKYIEDDFYENELEAVKNTEREEVL